MTDNDANGRVTAERDQFLTRGYDLVFMFRLVLKNEWLKRSEIVLVSEVGFSEVAENLFGLVAAVMLTEEVPDFVVCLRALYRTLMGWAMSITRQPCILIRKQVESGKR